MSRTGARRLAWGLWWIAVALFAGGVLIHVFEPASRDPVLPSDHSTLALVTFLLFALAFPTLGSLIARRLPTHPIGWLFCAAGFSELVRNLSGSFSRLAFHTHPEEPTFASLMLWISHQSSGLFVPLLIAAFFLFPDGRLPTRRWMPILIFVVVAAALRFVLAAGASWTLDGHPNAYAAEPPYGEVLQVIAIVFSRLSVVIALLALLSLIVRYRRSPQHERQQIKWVAVGTAVATATLLAYLGLGGWAWAATLGPAETPIVAVYAAGLLALPVSLAIAMLRYRLYDVDVLINRTLVYGATVMTLAGLYVVGIVGLQAALRPFTQGDELPVALTTLGAIALFAPIRARVQHAVDGRFYRSRYDATRTLDSLAVRLRDQVDLEALRAELLAAVRDTMQPAHASLWLRERAR